jgi:hypothetical protein
MFRCDTFVRHVFHKAGHDIPSFAGFNIPRLLFDAFPKSNNDGQLPSNTYHAHQNYQAPLLTAPRSMTAVSAEELMSMSSAEFMKTVEVPEDQITPEILKKTWEFAQNKALDSNKRVLLLDYLGLVGSIDLIDHLIQAYANESDADVKNMMLRSTLTLYQRQNADQTHAQTTAHLQAFYQGLLNNPLDNTLQTRDLPFVIQGFTTVSKASTVLRQHTKVDTIIRYHAHAMTPEARLKLNMMLAFKAKPLEAIYYPKITQLLIDTNRLDLHARFQRACSAS